MSAVSYTHLDVYKRQVKAHRGDGGHGGSRLSGLFADCAVFECGRRAGVRGGRSARVLYYAGACKSGKRTGDAADSRRKEDRTSFKQNARMEVILLKWQKKRVQKCTRFL